MVINMGVYFQVIAAVQCQNDLFIGNISSHILYLSSKKYKHSFKMEVYFQVIAAVKCQNDLFIGHISSHILYLSSKKYIHIVSNSQTMAKNMLSPSL